jgi:hypothetical protein
MSFLIRRYYLELTAIAFVIIAIYFLYQNFISCAYNINTDIYNINKMVTLCKHKALYSNDNSYYGIMLDSNSISLIKSNDIKDEIIIDKYNFKTIKLKINKQDNIIYYNDTGMAINTEHLLFTIKDKNNKLIKQGILHCTGMVNIWDIK